MMIYLIEADVNDQLREAIPNHKETYPDGVYYVGHVKTVPIDTEGSDDPEDMPTGIYINIAHCAIGVSPMAFETEAEAKIYMGLFNLGDMGFRVIEAHGGVATSVVIH